MSNRELDAWIAEHVMGSTVSEDKVFSLVYEGPDNLVETSKDRVLRRLLPHYSTNIAAAWEVVEKLKSNDYRFHLDSLGSFHFCFFIHEVYETTGKADANTAPLAICLAAKKAMENK